LGVVVSSTFAYSNFFFFFSVGRVEWGGILLFHGLNCWTN
jgi:hypothetical protein